MPARVFKTLIVVLSFVAQGAFGQSPSLKWHRSGVSDRDLSGRGTAAGRIGRVAAIAKAAAADTLRILAIRVDFTEDDNPLTTGNGKFVLTASEEATIDPAPHNRTYFEHQLLALANYFRTVSRGQLIIEFQVFPNDVNGALTTSQQMSFYSPTRDEELLDQRLSELFQEGLQLADASGGIDLSQFDSFILFHAGVGLDFAFDFDPTPQDIPSVFLDFATLREKLGDDDPNYQGIAVNNGQVFIRDGMILPETQSQEGFEIGLLGTMAIMFGHQLGLPNLFNTDNGRSGIGVFGLMDQGSGNFFGLLPAEPCAWSKVFLGWETPIEIRNGDNVAVAAPQSLDQRRIYKIPINSNEYFLIENRLRDYNDDGVAIGRDANGTRIEFKWDAQNGQHLLAEAPAGVIVQVNEYDFGLPYDPQFPEPRVGSGILIWHIDEDVIRANFAANRVNADLERRGVDLEEADGAQDIGQFYGFLSAGAGSETGVIEDMFWATNPINKLVNAANVVAFTASTKPNTSANSGGLSHVTIDNFSEPGEVMTFSVAETVTRSGFPQYVGASTNLSNSPMFADLNQDGTQELIWGANAGTKIFVWNADGSKFIPNDDSAQFQKLNGTEETLPLAVFAEPPGARGFSPAIAVMDNAALVVAVTDQAVVVHQPRDADKDGRADELFRFQNGETFSTHALILELNPPANPFRIIVGTEGGNIFAIAGSGNGTMLANVGDQAVSGFALFPSERIAYTTRNGQVGLVTLDGTVLWQRATNTTISNTPVVGDNDQNNAFNVIAISDDGQLFVFEENGDLSAGFPKATGSMEPSQMALADLNNDVYGEIIFVANSQLYAFNHAGFLTDGFPKAVSSAGSAASKSAPILADLDDDGVAEIVAGSSARQILAEAFGQKSISVFPLSTGASVSSTPAVADIDNDGSMELAAVADDGFLYVWNLPIPFDARYVPWGSFLANAQHTNLFDESRRPALPSGELMPANLVYNYPNPTEGNLTTIRYRLNFPAQVQVRIFDLAGELVDELTGPGFSEIENEVTWPLQNIQSGVYLARVEAAGEGRKDVVVFKIAVIK
ncbi:MAG TPA: T9SS type A sorting domain-containing protein [bacterium]